MRAQATVVALVLAAAAVAAQSPAPTPSPDVTTLYAHNADGSDELVGWTNTLEDDGDDVSMGPSGSCATHSGNDIDFTLVPPAEDVDRTYQLPLRPVLNGTMVLDPNGTIAATIHVGASDCYGEVDVTVRLLAGETVVAEGTTTGHRFNDDDAFPAAQVDMSPMVEEFPTGGLVWEIDVVGKTGGEVLLGVGEGPGRSRMDLPIVDVRAGPPPQFHNVTTEDLTISLGLENTTASHVYNWTRGPAHAVVFGQGNLSAGNVSVRAVDAANHTVFEANLSGTVNVTEQLQAEAGNWTVTVNATAATGNITLLFGPPSPSGNDGNTTGGPVGNGTGNTTDGGGKDSPAWPAAVLAAGLVALAAARRRR